MAPHLQRLGHLARASSTRTLPKSWSHYCGTECSNSNGSSRRHLSSTRSLYERRRRGQSKPAGRDIWRNPYLDIIDDRMGTNPAYQSVDTQDLEQQLKDNIGDDASLWAQQRHETLKAIGLPSPDEVADEMQRIDKQSGVFQQTFKPFNTPTPKIDKDYEDSEEDEEPDPEFDQDDITSDAHLELEQVRELRKLSRAIVWDMPLLYRHRKAFEPPTEATPLKFRYTTYLGEVHPAARKVVMTFSPSKLPQLTHQQCDKLIKLLGVRYNPTTKEAKMSCEMYPNVAQNKRFLGDLLDKLLTEARDGKDTFADVPFDFRHQKVKKQFVFPEEWKLTEERRRELASRRQERLLLEQEQEAAGQLVEGELVLSRFHASRSENEQSRPAQFATIAAGASAARTPRRDSPGSGPTAGQRLAPLSSR